MQLLLGPGWRSRSRLGPEEAAPLSWGRPRSWLAVRPGGGGRSRVVVGILIIVATKIDISIIVVFSLAAAPQGVPHGSVELAARAIGVALANHLARLLSLVLFFDSRARSWGTGSECHLSARDV